MSDSKNCLFSDIQPKQKGDRTQIVAVAEMMANVMNIDLKHSTPTGLRRLFVAASEIVKAGGKPEDVAGVYSRAREANKTYRTPMALASHWGEFYRSERPKYLSTAAKRNDFRVLLDNVKAASNQSHMDDEAAWGVYCDANDHANGFAAKEARRWRTYLRELGQPVPSFLEDSDRA